LPRPSRRRTVPWALAISAHIMANLRWISLKWREGAFR
jgi:hypothetical protein